MLLAGVMLATGAGAGFGMLRAVSQPGPLGAAATVTVPHGRLDSVAAALKDAGVVRSALMFRAAAVYSWMDGPVRAGELLFPAHASLAEVLTVLRHSRPAQHRITIAEGLTAAQVARLLAKDSALTGEIEVPLEGALLPDTYNFERNSTPGSLIAHASAAMDRVLAAAWATRAPGLPLASANNALILASIVEHEARLPAERPMIARVFLNRIAAGMRLQADPTTIYGAGGGLGALTREIRHDDLTRNDAYNTYVVDGLPAGPICNPGIAALHAVLHPSTGSALYFVADGTGGHVFSDSLTTHHANVARERGQHHP